MNAPVDWLLSGPSWVRYRTRRDLLDQPENHPEVKAAREAMLKDPKVGSLLEELQSWPGAPLKRHNDAKQHIHKLSFLADMGLKAGDPCLDSILEQVLARQSPDGSFQIVVNIPTHFGGSGKDEWQWMLCDAPTVLYALLKFGLEEHPRVQTALQQLGGLIRENGWPCAADSSLEKFRGPGRKGDPCPYANLLSLKALAQSKKWRDSETCKIGAETILSLWEQRKERKPFLFGMGTDFAKLKTPFIWYDILHVLEVLSQLPWLREDPRVRDMAELVSTKADSTGRYKPESIWMAWRAWDFGQKKEPSRWITLIVHRAQGRLLDGGAV